MNEDLTKLPKDLPIPQDDGTTQHLLGRNIPEISLQSSTGHSLDVSKINHKFTILYFFPMMVTPGENLPLGWNNIPGARGCTPQNIVISKYNKDLQKYNATVVGISTQSIDELRKLSVLRKLSQLLMSDNELKFQDKLNIPTFNVENKTMYKRLTLIVKDSKIIKVFYPIFPPDEHVFEIMEWLENNS